MDVLKERAAFEANLQPAERTVLTFTGVDGFDVYNCSIPFTWKGKR